MEPLGDDAVLLAITRDGARRSLNVEQAKPASTKTRFSLRRGVFPAMRKSQRMSC